MAYCTLVARLTFSKVCTKCASAVTDNRHMAKLQFLLISARRISDHAKAFGIS